MKLHEVMARREELKNQRAVYEELVVRLDRAIENPDGCGIPLEGEAHDVPSDCVQRVRTDIVTALDSIREDIEKIDQLDVEVGLDSK